MSSVRTAEPSDGPVRAPESLRPPELPPFLPLATVATIGVVLITVAVPSPISHAVRAVAGAGGFLVGVYQLLIAVTGRVVFTKSPTRLSGYARCVAAAGALFQAGVFLMIVPGLSSGWGLAVFSLGIAAYLEVKRRALTDYRRSQTSPKKPTDSVTASIDTIIAAVPDMDADEVLDLCQALKAVLEAIDKRS